jgi:hypothetical protein
LDPDIELTEIDYDDVVYYYNVQDLKDHVEESINTYIDEDLFIKGTHKFVNEEDEFENPVLSAYFVRGKDRDFYEGLDYNLTKDYLGPFDFENHDLKEFISNVTHMQISYNIKHFIPTESATPFDCFNWTITQNFDFTERNQVIENLKFVRHYCSAKESGTNFFTRYIWLNLIVIFVALSSLILHVLNFKEIATMYK